MLKTRAGDLVVPDKFMRMPSVRVATGLGASTIYRLIGQGRFPKPVKILNERTSAWLASEVAAWQRERVDARDAKRVKAS